jgi:hypothetical protein
MLSWTGKIAVPIAAEFWNHFLLFPGKNYKTKDKKKYLVGYNSHIKTGAVVAEIVW